jgi:hypothetical protein
MNAKEDRETPFIRSRYEGGVPKPTSQGCGRRLGDRRRLVKHRCVAGSSAIVTRYFRRSHGVWDEELWNAPLTCALNAYAMQECWYRFADRLSGVETSMVTYRDGREKPCILKGAKR